jgi:AraC family transcriptional regulator of adaptative response / DNA-3-methyladenine glycosylase II
MPPSRLRKEAKGAQGEKASPETITLQLSSRPPFAWLGILGFLSMRMLKGVEQVEGNEYSRTVRIGSRKGWVRVRHVPEKHALVVEITHSLTPVLPVVLGRLRHMFDLSARPDIISAHLMQDGILADIVARNPGLRVPGAFDGFELAVRAILGQQVTVKGATTLAGRFAEAFGDPIATPYPELTRLSPTPQRVATASIEEIAGLGIIRTRARSIITLAEEVASGRLKLEAGVQPEATIKQLVTLPGIGNWTAHYIAMRALRWPDAFPKEDIALRSRLGGVSAARAELLSQAWRPWRSYATLYLWQSSVQGKNTEYQVHVENTLEMNTSSR